MARPVSPCPIHSSTANQTKRELTDLRSARLDHFIEKFQSHASDRLVFRNRHVRQLIVVSKMTRVCIPVLVGHPVAGED